MIGRKATVPAPRIIVVPAYSKKFQDVRDVRIETRNRRMIVKEGSYLGGDLIQRGGDRDLDRRLALLSTKHHIK